MKTKNPMQLKAFIKKQAEEKHISAQLVMQNYMLERLLERISVSRYKNNFILKVASLFQLLLGLIQEQQWIWILQLRGLICRMILLKIYLRRYAA